MQNVMENLLKIQELEFKPGVPPEAILRELRQTVPLPILQHHDRMRVRGKKSVAFVRHGVCSECHMKVPVGVFATLMHGDDIQLCGSCGRYLALPPEAGQPAAPEPTPPAKPEKPKKRKNRTSND